MKLSFFILALLLTGCTLLGGTSTTNRPVSPKPTPQANNQITQPTSAPAATSTQPILRAITINDVPNFYKATLAPLEVALYPKTEIVQVREVLAGNGYSIKDEYHFASLDPKECYTLKNTKSVAAQNNVFSICIKELARINGNPEICNELTKTKQDAEIPVCLQWVAQNRSYLPACLSIPRSSDLTKDGDYNKSYSFSQCALWTIEHAPTIEGCNLLKQTINNDPLLYNICLSSLAQATKDTSYCQLIIGQDIQNTKRNCPLAAAVGQPGDSCVSLSTQDAKDQCYHSKANKEKDARWCNSIVKINGGVGEYSKTGCFANIVFLTKDISVCHAISDTTLKKSCYQQYAAFPRSKEDCASIENDYAEQKAICYWDYAGSHKDATVCEAIDPQIKESESPYRNIKQSCLSSAR